LEVSKVQIKKLFIRGCDGGRPRLSENLEENWAYKLSIVESPVKRNSLSRKWSCEW